MPTYDYECPACGHRFEKFQGINDAPLKTCPSCKGRKVKRLIGPGAGILFKGSGFYATDYRSESYKRAARSDGGAGTSSAGSGEAGGKKAEKSDAAPKKQASKAKDQG